jgi:hypothetical protein
MLDAARRMPGTLRFIHRPPLADFLPARAIISPGEIGNVSQTFQVGGRGFVY